MISYITGGRQPQLRFAAYGPSSSYYRSNAQAGDNYASSRRFDVVQRQIGSVNAQGGGISSFFKLSQAKKEMESVPMQQRFLLSFINGTSVPLSMYIPFPKTFLHGCDARIKQLWILVINVLIARATRPVQVGFAVSLVIASLFILPKRTARSQLKSLFIFTSIMFVSAALFADPKMNDSAARECFACDDLTAPSLMNNDYQYELLRVAGFIRITRYSISLAVKLLCYSLSILLSAVLVLTTTQPEAIAQAIRWYLTPLRLISVNYVEKIVFGFVLALRFLSVVTDVIRDIALGVAARGIDWKTLQFNGSMSVLKMSLAKLFSNIFKKCDDITDSLILRGFEGPGVQPLNLTVCQPPSKPINNIIALTVLVATVVIVLQIAPQV